MNRRSYTRRSGWFILVAVLLMIGIDYFFSPPHKNALRSHQTVAIQKMARKPPEVVPRIVEEPSVIESPVEEPLWRKNAVLSSVPKNKPRVALIIDDMGLDQKHSRDAAQLPGPLTLSYMPYAEHLREQTTEARAHGHELMVHVPMEPENPKLNAGPEVLTTAETSERFAKILDDDLQAFSGYVGINNHMGSKMTQDRAGMARVMTALKQRGLLFVDSRTIASSVAADEARKAGIPYAVRNVFIDDEETSRAIGGSLVKIEHLALRTGLVVAIGHPRAETVAALKAWIPTLKAKGIELVPVSAVVNVP